MRLSVVFLFTLPDSFQPFARPQGLWVILDNYNCIQMHFKDSDRSVIDKEKVAASCTYSDGTDGDAKQGRSEHYICCHNALTFICPLEVGASASPCYTATSSLFT